jgi:hypothetical protein
MYVASKSGDLEEIGAHYCKSALYLKAPGDNGLNAGSQAGTNQQYYCM